MRHQKHIVVVGAGIVGASIAWHLTRAGAKVIVVDDGGPGGVATPASFAWINASWGNPEPYFRLRQRSMREWTRLAREAPGIPLRWTGGLCWDLPAAEMDAFEALHSSWGYDVRRVDQDSAGQIEPNIVNPPETALFVAEEGAVEPILATLALIADAERHGARRVAGRKVHALRCKAETIVGVEVGDDLLAADEVVVAAGIDTPRLAASAGVRLELDRPPGLIVHSRPHEPLLNGLVLAPDLHMRQTVDGRLVAGADFGGADPGDDAERTAREVFGRMRSMLRGAGKLQLDFHTVGTRPMPKDGFPVVSRAVGRPGLYIAVMHSGVTLAPAVGMFVAEELLSGERSPLLAPYALSRF